MANLLRYLGFLVFLVLPGCGDGSSGSSGSSASGTSQSSGVPSQTQTQNTQSTLNKAGLIGDLKLDLGLKNSVIPKEILVDLLAFFDGQVKKNINKVFYNAQIEIIKSKILRHDLTIARTREYLNSLKTNKDLAPSVNVLLQMLTDKPDYPQLWLDFYGRVFDSIYVNELVKNPPVEVQDAMTAIGQSIGSNFKSIYNSPSFAALRDKLDNEVHNLLQDKDPRFWFPRVPELNDIKNDPSHIEAAKKVIEYLTKKKQTGYEVISSPYMVTKLGVLLKMFEGGLYTPEYIKEGDTIYFPTFDEMVTKVRGHRRGKASTETFLTKEGGIPLKGQPIVVKEPWFIDSERPTDERFPKLDSLAAMRPDAKFALLNQLDHGTVWCSGLSGSTNIDMHAWDWVANYISKYHGKKLGIQKNVDKKAAFLGTVMFLVYDGGHSIAETLWAANVIDKKLDLDFKLSDKKDIKDFVPDLEKYINIYKNTVLEQPIKAAFDKAFEALISNFRTHGFGNKFNVKMPSFK